MISFKLQVLVLLFPALLAGCMTTAEETQMTAETTPTQPEPVTPEPVQEPDPVPEPEIEPVQAPPSETLLTSTDLIGLEPAEIQGLLGPVSLRRWENDAQVVQYQNGHCVMDIYFYETAPGEAFKATYISARTSAGTSVMNDVCLSSIMGGVWVEDNLEGSGPGGD